MDSVLGEYIPVKSLRDSENNISQESRVLNLTLGECIQGLTLSDNIGFPLD